MSVKIEILPSVELQQLYTFKLLYIGALLLLCETAMIRDVVMKVYSITLPWKQDVVLQ